MKHEPPAEGMTVTETLTSPDGTANAVERRGRGKSGDTKPYAIEREFDDVAAVVGSIGEPVSLLGHSSGGTCALEAAHRVDALL